MKYSFLFIFKFSFIVSRGKIGDHCNQWMISRLNVFHSDERENLIRMDCICWNLLTIVIARTNERNGRTSTTATATAETTAIAINCSIHSNCTRNVICRNVQNLLPLNCSYKIKHKECCSERKCITSLNAQSEFVLCAMWCLHVCSQAYAWKRCA